MRDELWLKHDARSRLDPKMSLFLKTEGMLGYGVFWSLVEILHYQNDHEFDKNVELGGIAAQLGVEELVLQNIVQRLVMYGLLQEQDGKIFQKRLKAEQAQRSTTKQNILLQKREAARLGGIKSGESRKEAKKQLEELNQLEELENTKHNEASALKHEANELDKKRIDKNRLLVNTPSAPQEGETKKPKPVFNPEGKTKYHDWVYLSDEQFERVKRYYTAKGLSSDDFLEAVRELDSWFENNPQKRPKRTDDAKALMGWPLDRALQRKRNLQMAQHSQNLNNGRR